MLAKAAEADDVLLRQTKLLVRLLDTDLRRKNRAVPPVEGKKLHLLRDVLEIDRANRPAFEPVHESKLLKHFARQPDLADVGRGSHTLTHVHRVAADDNAVRQ